MRDQHARAGIGEHEGQALLRVARVERQIGAAGLEDAEHRHDHVERARKAQPHHHLGANPARAQVMRQPVGAPIELAIAEAFILEGDRNRIRAVGNLRREQLGQGGGRMRMRGGVPPPQDALAFLPAQNVQVPDRTLGFGDCGQQPQESLLTVGKFRCGMKCWIGIEVDSQRGIVRALVNSDR